MPPPSLCPCPPPLFSAEARPAPPSPSLPFFFPLLHTYHLGSCCHLLAPPSQSFLPCPRFSFLLFWCLACQLSQQYGGPHPIPAVRVVSATGPSLAAGLQPGDLVSSIGGRQVASLADFNAIVSSVRAPPPSLTPCLLLYAEGRIQSDPRPSSSGSAVAIMMEVKVGLISSPSLYLCLSPSPSYQNTLSEYLAVLFPCF